MKKLSKDEIEYISKYYECFGPTAISIKLGRSSAAVGGCGKRLGLSVNKKIKKDITELPDFTGNVDIFDVITREVTPELAYFIGFFWADGTNGNKSISIEIVEDDGIELEPIFMNIFNFNISKRNREGRKPQMTFRTGSSKAAEWFTNMGKYPRTHESHIKILEYIPKNLHRFFLLGLIDGDGCFYIKNNTVQFSISGNIEQDWSALEELLKSYSPSINKEDLQSGKSSVIRITNITNIRKLIKYLYNNTTLGLSRKRNKAEEILNTKFKMYDFPIIVKGQKYTCIKEYCNNTGENHANVIKNLNNKTNNDYKYYKPLELETNEY